MFGAISTAEISAKLVEHGIEIERKRIHLGQGPVKLLGKHTTSIRLHGSVMVEQEFEVVSENPIEVAAEEAPEAEEREYRDDKKTRKPRKEKAAKSE
jgi:large subunit ribosomal protein L9